MTANVSLEQFVHLKQPASDYLSQAYQIISKLNNLIETLKDFLSSIQEHKKSSHTLLDKGYIPVKDLDDLNTCQIQAIKSLQVAAKDIEAFDGFKIYSSALKELEKQEETHA